MRELLVAVGSRNPSKVKGVLRAFKTYYEDVNVIAVDPPEHLPPQPIGLEATILGAVERGLHALLSTRNSDFGVGVEAGFIRFPSTITGYLDVQIACIVDRGEKVTIGTCQGFEFPVAAVEKVCRGEVLESEEVIVEITGIQGIGENIGAIGYLSRNIILREDLTFQAVVSALIPRLNSRLYFRKWPKAREVLEELKQKLSGGRGLENQMF